MQRCALVVPLLHKHTTLPPTASKEGKEEKDEFAIISTPSERKQIVREILMPMLKGMGLGFDRWTGLLTFNDYVAYNSSPAKYLQFIDGINSSTKLTVAGLVNGSNEFGSLDALYDETFVHSVRLQYVPRNHYNTAAYATGDGDFKNVGTCAAVVVALQHNASAYGDAATAWSSMYVQRLSQLVDMSTRWNHEWRNSEKFAWDSPLGDQSTSVSTQGWCQNSLVNTKYGGFFQLATCLASGASLGIGSLLEGAIPGDWISVAHISMRARG